MNHMVSETRNSSGFHPMSGWTNIDHTCVPSVANNLFAAYASFFVSARKSVDFHAFVYHTIHIVLKRFLILASL